MTMVKLPNLERKELERIVEALDHYCAALCVIQSEDTAEYTRLAEMLKRRVGLRGGASHSYSLETSSRL
jgi:hypothetical protein